MNMTEGDMKASKPEPKVTREKAGEVVGPKVTALLNEVVAGFELDPADKKSRKRIIQAVAEATGRVFDGQAGLTPRSIARQFNYGLTPLFPKPEPMESESEDGYIDDEADYTE